MMERARRRQVGASGLLFAVVVLTQPAAAQLEPRVPVLPQVGEEVRVVRVGERGAVYGPFVEANGSDVVLEAGDGVLRIARSSISGMSVQRGHRSKAMIGGLVGLGAGMLAGVLLGGSDGGGLDSTATGAAVGAGGGLAVGLLLGWSIRSPEWLGVDMDGLRPSP